MKDKREQRTSVQQYADRVCNEALAAVQLCEERLAMCAFLRARCDSAGDAACVVRHDAEASATAEALREAKDKLEACRGRYSFQAAADTLAAEVAELERAYDLMREYALQRHGADWERPYTKLSDDKLREQVRAWRSPEAPPSK